MTFFTNVYLIFVKLITAILAQSIKKQINYCFGQEQVLFSPIVYFGEDNSKTWERVTFFQTSSFFWLVLRLTKYEVSEA